MLALADLGKKSLKAITRFRVFGKSFMNQPRRF